MFKKGDLVRFKDSVSSGTWGFKDQVAIVIRNSDEVTRVMVLAWRKGNHKNAANPDGIGVYTYRLEKL